MQDTEGDLLSKEGLLYLGSSMLHTKLVRQEMPLGAILASQNRRGQLQSLGGLKAISAGKNLHLVYKPDQKLMAGKGGSWALVGKQLLLVSLNEQHVPQNCHLHNYVCNHGLMLLSAWVREVPLFQWSVGKKKREIYSWSMIRIRDRKECSTINRAFMSAPPSLQGHH